MNKVIPLWLITITISLHINQIKNTCESNEYEVHIAANETKCINIEECDTYYSNLMKNINIKIALQNNSFTNSSHLLELQTSPPLEQRTNYCFNLSLQVVKEEVSELLEFQQNNIKNTQLSNFQFELPIEPTNKTTFYQKNWTITLNFLKNSNNEDKVLQGFTQQFLIQHDLSSNNILLYPFDYFWVECQNNENCTKIETVQNKKAHTFSIEQQSHKWKSQNMKQLKEDNFHIQDIYLPVFFNHEIPDKEFQYDHVQMYLYNQQDGTIIDITDTIEIVTNGNGSLKVKILFQKIKISKFTLLLKAQLILMKQFQNKANLKTQYSEGEILDQKIKEISIFVHDESDIFYKSRLIIAFILVILLPLAIFFRIWYIRRQQANQIERKPLRADNQQQELQNVDANLFQN